MENVKVVLEDLLDRFRSKRDMYNLLTKDRKLIQELFVYSWLFLTTFAQMTLTFSKKVLEVKKKVNIDAIIYSQMLKQKDITIIKVPKYKELSVTKIWTLVKETDDIFQYFPDYSNKQFPDRDYMFSILWTLRFDTMQKMIEKARKNRALENN